MRGIVKKARLRSRLFLFREESLTFNFMNQDILNQFIQLFTLADSEATQHLTDRLALVLQDATAYQAEYAGELAERGIETTLPAQELRDVALIDALLSEELLWEADWKDSVNDLTYGLNETLTQQGRSERLAEPSLARRATTGQEALDALQDALEPLGLALVLLTLDSDSHALSVVADAQAEQARNLAQKLGFKLAVY
jgi:hypothetical protein